MFEEHLHSELIQNLLRDAIAFIQPRTSPRTVLTSFPQEQHSIGLIVALSFNSSCPEVKVEEGWKPLRLALPVTTRRWAGDAGAMRLRKPPAGVQQVVNFNQMAHLIKQRRAPDA